MKKIIESDLISIAHRILKLKDKSEISSLLKETQLLQNKLILLQFYEDNKFRLDASLTPEKLLEAVNVNDNKEEAVSVFLSEEKENHEVTFEEEIITPIELSVTNEVAMEPSVDVVETVAKVEDSMDESEETTAEPQSEINTTETFTSAADHVEFTPSIEETIKTIDEVEEEIKIVEQLDPLEEAKQAVERATLEIDPVFYSSHNELFNNTVSITEEEKEPFKVPQHFVTNQATENPSENYRQAPLNKSINDAFANKISIGLNDRIAFEKNLFNGSSDDLNRVISQLNTIESYEEAKDFIDDLVKPEFNNWTGKDDYESRFMELVEKRFL